MAQAVKCLTLGFSSGGDFEVVSGHLGVVRSSPILALTSVGSLPKCLSAPPCALNLSLSNK